MLLLTIDAAEIMALFVLGEIPQHEVVRLIVAYLVSVDGVYLPGKQRVAGSEVDADGVAPKGVVLGDNVEVGGEHGVAEREGFAGLVEVVATDIVERVEAVCAIAYVVNDEIAVVIAAGDACEG